MADSATFRGHLLPVCTGCRAEGLKTRDEELRRSGRLGCARCLTERLAHLHRATRVGAWAREALLGTLRQRLEDRQRRQGAIPQPLLLPSDEVVDLTIRCLGCLYLRQTGEGCPVCDHLRGLAAEIAALEALGAGSPYVPRGWHDTHRDGPEKAGDRGYQHRCSICAGRRRANGKICTWCDGTGREPRRACGACRGWASRYPSCATCRGIGVATRSHLNGCTRARTDHELKWCPGCRDAEILRGDPLPRGPSPAELRALRSRRSSAAAGR